MSSIRFILGVALLLIGSGCGSSSSPYTPTPTPTPAPGNGTGVSIVAGATTMGTSAYAPSPVTIAVGGSVTWTNNDNISHTSTGSAWNSGTIAPGGKYTATFSSAGSFVYHCSIHPGMTGTVTVQ